MMLRGTEEFLFVLLLFVLVVSVVVFVVVSALAVSRSKSVKDNEEGCEMVIFSSLAPIRSFNDKEEG